MEAIETLFVPVAIYNNADGDDARALERFAEPAWNNPVVRFLDPLGKDVIPRKDGVWTAAALAARMTTTLAAAKREVPLWWKLAELDARTPELSRAVFAMHCFWVGQARLGALDGVADARPAFIGELEVVDVRYDPARLSLANLAAAASKSGCADRVWLERDLDLAAARAVLGERAQRLEAALKLAPESDDLRSLKASAWARAELVRSQAVWFNAVLAADPGAAPLGLSPRQRERVAQSARATEPPGGDR